MQYLEQEADRKISLILCNGTPPCEALLRHRAQQAMEIICCDGAAEYAWRAGIQCDFLVGDFDSLGLERAHEISREMGSECIILPQRKDKTDSQVAAELAIQNGGKQLWFLGALGGRFDMALANAELLVHCKLSGVDAVIEDEQNEMYATCTHLFIDGAIGDTLSILPLGVNCAIRCTKGLDYPLYDYTMTLGDSRTISNVFTQTRAYVEVAHGWVLIIKARDMH